MPNRWAASCHRAIECRRCQSTPRRVTIYLGLAVASAVCYHRTDPVIRYPTMRNTSNERSCADATLDRMDSGAAWDAELYCWSDWLLAVCTTLLAHWLALALAGAG